MRSFGRVIAEIKGLVTVNAHTEAYVMGCEYLYEIDPDVAWCCRHRMLSILGQVERYCCIPSYLYERRKDVYNNMLTIARALLPQDEYEQFYQAF